MPHDRALAEEHYDAALERLTEGEPAAAAACFHAAIAADATFIDAQHGLIRALQDAKRFDEAIAAAKALSASQPDDVLAYTALSILYQHAGMIPEAEAAGLQAKLLSWKQQLRAGQA